MGFKVTAPNNEIESSGIFLFHIFYFFYFTFISKLFGVKERVFCAMRLFTEAEEQIEEPVQRNDDVGCYAAEDEDDRDGSNDVASGHSRTEL